MTLIPQAISVLPVVRASNLVLQANALIQQPFPSARSMDPLISVLFANQLTLLIPTVTVLKMVLRVWQPTPLTILSVPNVDLGQL